MLRIVREQRERVEDAIDRRQSLEVACLLLEADAVETARKRAPPQRTQERQPRNPTLKHRHRFPGGAQRPTRRDVEVGAGKVVTMCREVDGVVGLGIELAPQFLGDRAEVAAEARAVKEADGEIDVAGMAIEMIG